MPRSIKTIIHSSVGRVEMYNCPRCNSVMERFLEWSIDESKCDAYKCNCGMYFSPHFQDDSGIYSLYSIDLPPYTVEWVDYEDTIIKVGEYMMRFEPHTIPYDITIEGLQMLELFR
jgi:hypothetical protein